MADRRRGRTQIGRHHGMCRGNARPQIATGKEETAGEEGERNIGVGGKQACHLERNGQDDAADRDLDQGVRATPGEPVGDIRRRGSATARISRRGWRWKRFGAT